MVMASSLTRTPKSSELTPLTPLQARVAELMASGTESKVIAQKLAKGDKKKAASYRRKIRYWMGNVPAFQLAVYGGYKTEMALALGPGIQGLAKRAKRGRVDANKLIMEATGFHNPRVQHEHSGEVNINIKMPRPRPVDSTSGEIVDAEVVD